MRGEKWTVEPRRRSPYLQAVIYIPGAGDRKVRRSTGTADPREAEIRAGAIWVKEMRRAGAPLPEDAAALARATVELAAAEFLAHLEKVAHEHREQFVKRYEADLKLYVIPRSADEIRQAEGIGKRPWQPPWTFVDEITSATWEAEKLRLHKANGGPLGSRSIQHLTNTLRHFLRFCVAQGYLESAPELKAPKQKLVRQERRFRRAMPPKERERFIRAAYEYRPKVVRKGPLASHAPGTAGRFYEALHFSLLRRGELWALSRRWIDFQRNEIRVPPDHSKSGEEEFIHLHVRAKKALRAQIRARGKKFPPDAPLFGRINVKPAFEFAIARAKIDRYGVTAHHTTRHTGGTILSTKTRDREALKKAGRWRSDSSVDPYIHTSAEHARPLMKKL